MGTVTKIAKLYSVVRFYNQHGVSINLIIDLAVSQSSLTLISFFKNRLIMLKTFKLLFVLCVVAVMGSNALGQTRYWVFFTDKKGVTLDSASFCNQFWAINGAEETDYPVSDQYISAVNAIAKSTGHTTRWFNAVAVEANSRQLKQIAKLPFVKYVRPTEGYFSVANHSASIMSNDEIVLDLAFRQTERMGGRYFRDSSITGKGVRIAIFDGGFPGVDKHEAFEHIRKENRIIATYDFTKNKTNVYHSNNHGTNVMSCIGGMYGDIPLGLAPDAEFLLAITEVAKEPFSEEENWLAAVEWAHRNGAKIINSSLGYTYHRYFTNQMDGRTSLVARAALLAARKGMLVVNAAGNEGTDEWRAIGTPADADSILTIGGVSPDTHLHIDFSSYGPTADGRRKPNVSAFGKAVVAKPTGGYNTAFGTSFASPLVAGFVACAWQLNPDMTNIELLEAIQQSADLYPYFDYAHGYGVPQAGYFINDPTNYAQSFDLYEYDTYYLVRVPNKTVDLISGYNTSVMFYSIVNPEGLITEYSAVRVYSPNALRIYKESLSKGDKLYIHYLGYTGEYEF